jgi:hypothetical protein
LKKQVFRCNAWNHAAKVPGVKIPSNVLVTDWLQAHQVNPIADLSLIHGGIGTVMTAALACKPVVGIGMQPEQTANLVAIQQMPHNPEAKRRAVEFARVVAQRDGPRLSAELL